ncbi:Uncharacterized protein Fot_29570 [Forsythia ovata]|uniref:TF-B3 domain-containing protein n=1 Tax=Forsythia ovata TaxID=205694 RepID=A0ABD1TSA1_9LAMI
MVTKHEDSASSLSLTKEQLDQLIKLINLQGSTPPSTKPTPSSLTQPANSDFHPAQPQTQKWKQKYKGETKEMVCDGEACEECAQNCLLMHRKQNDPQPFARFFKVMIGEDYSKVLYLPPDFARKVPDMIGHETHLEDSSGRLWPVTYSIVDGSLAFHKGWPEFSLDHDLQLGQLLTFLYIAGNHFVVQIFGTSGCEVLNFDHGRGRSNTTSTEDEEVVDENEPFQTNDLSSGSDFGRLEPTINMDDPTYMLNRDARDNQREDKFYLYGLSQFEMGRNKSDEDKIEKVRGGEIAPEHSQIRKQVESKANVVQIAENLEDHAKGCSKGILSGTSPTELDVDCDEIGTENVPTLRTYFRRKCKNRLTRGAQAGYPY